MSIEHLYQETLEKLKADKRPLIAFSSTQELELKETFVKAIEQADAAALKMIFCLLANARSPLEGWAAQLTDFLKREKRPELLIYALSSAQKHLVEYHMLRGERLPGEFLLALEQLLQRNNSELLEWALRLIEGLGGQSLFFKNKLQKIRPPFWKWDQHSKNARGIIKLLEGRWK